jgi:hypothetical protein
MQILFWNPFTSDQEIEDQDWYRSIATYGLDSGKMLFWNPFTSVELLFLSEKI